MRTFAILAVVIAVGAAIGIGLKQASSNDGSGAAQKALKPTAQETAAALSGAPAPLSALHAQADALLGGGKKALHARLAALRGHPVVVNVWASWCGPCRTEMPALQRVALQRGRSVAFVGVNLKDNRAAARRFLQSVPLSYPSYEDPDGQIYNDYALAGAPSTVFYDAAGHKAFTHQGPFLTTADLNRDIDRYALGKPAAASS
jgi:cytochrome c biogenesis protein CcmG, thiol:disulfide interchange protein DsbE